MSEYYDDIENEWLNSSNNILVKAVAGSGKTTTITNLVNKTPNKKYLYCAFNSSIQKEMESKTNFVPNIICKTMHSIGLQCIRNFFDSVKVNNSKTFNIFKKIELKNKTRIRSMTWKDRTSLMFYVTNTLNISRTYLTEDIDSINKLMLQLGNSYRVDSFSKQIALEAIEEMKKYKISKKYIEVDFVDMIYLPYKLNLSFDYLKDYNYLAIDEAQDLSLLQHKILYKIFVEGEIEKFIAVGDPNQSIYLFGGAYSNSMDLFNIYKIVEKPLPNCYRCATKIINEANKIFPGTMLPIRTEEGEINIFKDEFKIKEDSMVLCRNTEPLILLYFKLLAEGKRPKILGEDITKSIINLLKANKTLTIQDCINNLSIEIAALSNIKTDEANIRTNILQDSYALLVNLQKCLNLPNCEDYIIAIEKATQNDGNILLSTIHKSKGLENDIVYILDEDLMPSKYSKTDEQLLQERNLRYVAITRAKNELNYIYSI